MKKEILARYAHRGMVLYYLRDENGTVGLELLPAALEAAWRPERAYVLEPLVQAKLAGDDYPNGFAQGRSMRWGETVRRMEYAGQARQGGRIVTTLRDARGYEYRHVCVLNPASPSIETSVEFTNHSSAPAVLEMLASFTLGGLTPFEDGLCEETLVLHRLRSTWSSEGRLVSEPVESLGLEPSWKCYSANSLRFGQLGSMPVRGWAPLAAVEDTARGVVWAAATTHASSWQIEAWRRDNALVLSGGIADREFGHWTKTVPSGGCFATPKAVLTVVRGSLDEAAQRVAENTRAALELPAGETALSIVFNEFCTSWGVPTASSVQQAVDVLAGQGIEYFVIDAGWYDDAAFEEASSLGHWQVSRKAFPDGLAPVVDYIHRHGMKAGLWFEFEVAGRDAAECFAKTDWLLCRDGVPITSGDRRFWDFRKPEVIEYLAERVIARLRADGFDYVKVDYNETIGLGCDGGDSPGDGLYTHVEAVQAFFRRIKRELPHMVIEVCASGGHRLVHSFLELASMASFSDAHECDEIPLIAANMHRMLLPRQSQIWAVVRRENPREKLYYQIASGLLGRLCLSGDILDLPQDWWEVIGAGIAFYKKAATVIDQGTSHILGSESKSYRRPRGWQAVVRRGQAAVLVVAHTFRGAPDALRVEIPAECTLAHSFHRPGLAARVEDGYLLVEGAADFDGAAFLLEFQKNVREL